VGQQFACRGVEAGVKGKWGVVTKGWWGREEEVKGGGRRGEGGGRREEEGGRRKEGGERREEGGGRKKERGRRSEENIF
jgi:hypothetical protein